MKNIFSVFKRKKSGDVAKDRLKILLISDRVNCSPEVLERIKADIAEVISKYMKIDVNTMEIVATATERTSGTDDLFGKLGNMAKKLTANLNGSSSSVKTAYNIGDEGPGGGIVFYYSEEGFDVYEPDGSVKRCNYLEVSKTEVANVSWCSRRSSSSCCSINTNEGVGFGKMNTYKIINGKHSGGVVSSTNCAAKACAEYSTTQTTKGDWFLPSKDELNLLYKNLGTRIMATASEAWHWSSSQYGDNSAWNQRFSDGDRRNDYKNYTYSFRAIRAF